MNRRLLLAGLMLCAAACAGVPGPQSPAAVSDDNDVLSIDHYVRVKSTAPAMAGQTAQLYARERVAARNIQRGGADIVLFVHGAGTPAEVAFDVPYGDYSWM